MTLSIPPSLAPTPSLQTSPFQGAEFRTMESSRAKRQKAESREWEQHETRYCIVAAAGWPSPHSSRKPSQISVWIELCFLPLTLCLSQYLREEGLIKNGSKIQQRTFIECSLSTSIN